MSDPEDADREVDTILLKTGPTLLLSKEDILTFWFVYEMITKTGFPLFRTKKIP